MVASPIQLLLSALYYLGVSIPFIAGQWSLHHRPNDGADHRPQVSIPFIAGQWSLHARNEHADHARNEFQSPSLRGSGRFRRVRTIPPGRSPGFNPLHCGAVVASGCTLGREPFRALVSIPFIAGQWSLQRVLPALKKYGVLFQSPSLRGSGRFCDSPVVEVGAGLFQSPSLRGSGRFEPLIALVTEGDHDVSIPFIAGQWSLRAVVWYVGEGRGGFQSPSLRGSGRFPKRACAPRLRRGRVSIPFIAGQWSLRQGGPHGGHLDRGFNPLHCGAVVASRRAGNGAVGEEAFQSPSLRGSGRFARRKNEDSRLPASFQSPSLRGSGRFGGGATSASQRAARFNPLHCGAVVASSNLDRAGLTPPPCFNPLHCGAVVASAGAARAKEVRSVRVSIPFIAGQWSLPPQRRRRPARSAGVSIPFIAGQWSLLVAASAVRRAQREGFNPLHCGAVVASFERPPPHGGGAKVSIPFIAGQWSLLSAVLVAAAALAVFQSPSLRGSGRFRRVGGARRRRCAFQSPSLRGSGRFNPRRTAGREGPPGFQSPSLRGSGRFATRLPPSRRRARFQSPSLRGSGRFPWKSGDGVQREDSFNPLHCGAVVASGARRLRLTAESRFNPLHCGAVVASVHARHPGRAPLLAFQSPSLRGSGRFDDHVLRDHLSHVRFNPLHCGAVVASRRKKRRKKESRGVSIPFIAGQWSLRRAGARRALAPHRFNPLHCGAVVASVERPIPPHGHGCFNPLHCGAVVASVAKNVDEQTLVRFQSPSLRGSGRFRPVKGAEGDRGASFNPLHCGAVVASR